MDHLTALTAGVVLDWLFGEPEIFLHPVCIMGKLIAWTEKKLRRTCTSSQEEGRMGVVLVGFVLVCSFLFPLALLHMISFFTGRFSAFVSWCLHTFWCFQLLAAKSLYQESAKVREALAGGEREKARNQVSRIVGRDTKNLDEAGITRAAVETVAENTSDGVIAPLLFCAVFGVLGGFFYKAVNTMDSMIGYKNEQYQFFGRAAAKFDDLCNFLPARITGGLLVASAWILGCVDDSFSGRSAWKIFCRDRKKHESPNSAHGEAACAGALHIGLGGDAWYFGILHHKPVIGDEERPVEPEDIRRVGKMMILSEILGLMLCWLGFFLLSLISNSLGF